MSDPADPEHTGQEPANEESTDPPRPEPYVYSHDHIATAAAVLDIVFTDRLTGWDGWGAVDNATKDVEPPLPAALVRTLGQTAARPLRLGMSGERPGCDLQLGGDVPAMPLIKDIPPDVIELWANVADH